ncbi:hypothetical protein PS880_06174 [Pseudomonas fluorescens]|uniref:Uncharacterized protein n=1 Tax=Pseudomonas fluorescens TaxID=294 RepID=A0A5E7QGC2_PSEFL|nr:hypothetical protein PS880_06174 [Pseudomonas fluorescens]
MGQRRHLFGGEAYADRQVQGVLAGDGVVHQVAEHGLVGGQTFEETLSGTGDHCLLNQPLFVEAVTQAFGTVVRVVAEVPQQVVRAHELLEVGQHRVGFDQVFLRIGLTVSARQALHPCDQGARGGDWRGARSRGGGRWCHRCGKDAAGIRLTGNVRSGDTAHRGSTGSIRNMPGCCEAV